MKDFLFNGRNSSSAGGKDFPCVLGQICFPPPVYFLFYCFPLNRTEGTVGNFWTLSVIPTDRSLKKTKKIIFSIERGREVVFPFSVALISKKILLKTHPKICLRKSRLCSQLGEVVFSFDFDILLLLLLHHTNELGIFFFPLR